MEGRVEPFLFVLQLVVEHGKEPHLPPLKPNKLVGVEYRAIAVQAGKKAAALAVNRMIQPKGQDIFEQFAAVLLGVLPKLLGIHEHKKLFLQCKENTFSGCLWRFYMGISRCFLCFQD